MRHSPAVRTLTQWAIVLLALGLALPAGAANTTALLFQFGPMRIDGQRSFNGRGAYVAFLRVFGTGFENAVVTPPGRPPIDMFDTGFNAGGFGDVWQVSGQTIFLSEAELLENYPLGTYTVDINVDLPDEDRITTQVTGTAPTEIIQITDPAHLDPAVNPAGLTIFWDPCLTCSGDIRSFIFDKITGNAFDFLTHPTNSIGWIVQAAIPSDTAIGVELQNRLQNLSNTTTQQGDSYQDEVNFLISNRVFFSTTVAPDGDSDGVLDMADNCELVANADQNDADGDREGDLCDNCPATFNSVQNDQDSDGFGDGCDNCPKIANVNGAPTDCNDDGDFLDPGEAIGEQCDRNDNGIGDACEKIFVGLKPPSMGAGPVAAAATSDLTFDLTIECVAIDIGELGVGVLLPLGWTSVDFAGCDPPGPMDPLKIGSCDSATLGPTVDPLASSTFGPGLVPTTTIDADAVYISLLGAPGNGGKLCSTVDPGPHLLGTLTLSGVDASSAPVLTIDGLAELGLPVLQDPNEANVDLADAQFDSGAGDPTVSLELGPALADPTGTLWQVVLDASLELESLTFAVRGAPGSTFASLRFVGCDTPVGGTPQRTCSPDLSLGAHVDPALSSTQGPDLGLPVPNVLYVSLAGSLAQGAAGDTLNVRGQPVVLGVVETPNTPFVPPDLVLDGIELIDPTPVEPLLDPDVPLSEVALGFGLQPGDDYDHDGRQDDFDNCPNFSNLGQDNNGGLQTVLPDLFGDLCQCADNSGDGAVFTNDADFLRNVLTGVEQLEPGAATCQVVPGEACSVIDLAVLLRNLAAQPGPSIETGCPAAQRE